MPGLDRFSPSEVTSEVDCHREEVLDLDDIFQGDADLDGDRPRGGWACTISLFVLEDDFALGEEVELEIAFASYNIGDDDVCELVDIEVATAYRGHGLGKRLMEEVLRDIKLKGGTRVYVFAYEPEEGSREEFFTRFGFRALEVPDREWLSTSLPHPMRLELEHD
jgi:GNAT superfamily N-acetyltransferase